MLLMSILGLIVAFILYEFESSEVDKMTAVFLALVSILLPLIVIIFQKVL